MYSDERAPSRVTLEEEVAAADLLPAMCPSCSRRYVDASALKHHARSCKRKDDSKLLVDPTLHVILRPFGWRWNRFYVVQHDELDGKVLAWHHSNLIGPVMESMIEDMWERVSLERGVDEHDLKKEEYVSWCPTDGERCPHCGILGAHVWILPAKPMPYTEADRTPVLDSPRNRTSHSHRTLCPHKHTPSSATSGIARVVHSKRMAERALKQPKLKLHKGEMKSVAHEKTLGLRVSADASLTAAAQHRVHCAWGAFNALKPALLHPDLELVYKIIIFRAMVVSVLLWGCEVWSVKNDTGCVVEFIHKCMAIILDRPLVERDYKEPMVDVIACIILRQLHYLGHRLRGPPSAPPLRALLSRIAIKAGSSVTTRSPAGPHGRGGHETPSARYTEETNLARSVQFQEYNGPNPEDVDFVMDRKRATFAESMLGLTPFTTFAEMFDAAQDRAGWDRMAKEQAKTIHKKNL
jgi:hypothetical protein